MNIYVGNLSLETTADELRKEFTEFGEVVSVTVMNDVYIGSGQSRGYGYIQMVSKSAGAIAIATLEGKILRDRSINVVEALPLTNKNAPVATEIRNSKRSFSKRERNWVI